MSLARAGTPLGVLLKRTLNQMGRDCVHYSISIIRDRGIDTVALDHIIAGHRPESIFFVDGWTGKGTIAGELTRSVAEYNACRRLEVRDSLYVVADLVGVAELAGSSEDYLIPSAILNSVVSDLVSRTILNDDCVGEGDFHACLFCEEYRDVDLSNWFIDVMMGLIEVGLQQPEQSWPVWTDQRRAELRCIAEGFADHAMRRYNVRDRNRIKPGVGESTRALLRRMPDRLLLRESDSPEVEHLQWLADQRDVRVEHAAWLPYGAAAIISLLGPE